MIVPASTTRRWATTAAVIALSGLLAGCGTGVRPELRPSDVAVGNEAVDAVLTRVLSLPDAVYTAEYASTVVFDDSTTDVTATQASPGRHSLTIGDIRYLVSGQQVSTCWTDEDRCEIGHDAALVSNTLLAPDFFYSNVASRLRRDAALAVGPPTASSAQVEGDTATCVTIPLPTPPSAANSEPSATYCAFDNGVVTSVDSLDLVVTLTSYSTEPDDALLRD